MWWVAAMGAAKGFLGGLAGREQAKLEQFMAKSQNKARVAANEAGAARGALARWVQSVNNNQHLRATAEAMEANAVNTARTLDSMAKGNFSESIRASEEAGMMAASQAFAGIGGSVTDQVAAATSIRQGLMQQDRDRLVGTVAYDSARRQGAIASQMAGGLDNSVLIDDLDYRIDSAASPKSHWHNMAVGALNAMADSYTGWQRVKSQSNAQVEIPEGTIMDNPTKKSTFSWSPKPSSWDSSYFM